MKTANMLGRWKLKISQNNNILIDTHVFTNHPFNCSSETHSLFYFGVNIN